MHTNLIATLCSIFFYMAINSYGQLSDPVEVIAKNTQFVGGDFSFSYSNTENDFGNTSEKNKNMLLRIGPTYGKYFKDNLAWGSYIGYSFQKTKNTNGDFISNSSGLGLTLFLTKDYKITNNLFFELEPRLSGNYSVEKTESAAPDITYKSILLGVSISPGFLFFINTNFGIRASIGNLRYSYSRTKINDHDYVNTTHNFGLGGGLSDLFLSLRYYIR